MEFASLTSAALTVAVSLLTSGTQAGVVPISRTSVLRVSGVAGSDADTFDETRSSDGAGADTLTGGATGVDGTIVQASAAQGPSSFLSTTDAIAARARGGANVFASFTSNGPLDLAITTATSDFSLHFRIVGDAEPFSVSGVFGGGPDTSATVTLSQMSDSSIAQLIFSADNVDPSGPTFHYVTRLSPGDYTLDAHAFAGSTGGDGSESQSSTFDTSFSVGHTARPIPLPPAALTGGALLILIAGARVLQNPTRNA